MGGQLGPVALQPGVAKEDPLPLRDQVGALLRVGERQDVLQDGLLPKLVRERGQAARGGRDDPGPGGTGRRVGRRGGTDAEAI